MARICPNCGSKLREKASFCGKCGKSCEKQDTLQKNETLPSNNALGLIKAHKKGLIAVGALALAVVVILLIINPANSPKAVFNRYLDCLRTQNSEAFAAISYDANFSNSGDKSRYTSLYESRFSSAGNDYKNNGRVNLLNNTQIRITRIDTPKQAEIAARRANLKADYKNTARITDIRNITFEIIKPKPKNEQSSNAEGETQNNDKDKNVNKTIGTAELICVTGKWYIGDVTGI